MTEPGTNRRWHHAALFAGLLTLLQALPWLPLLICRISPVAFAAESVAYRYFHSFRLIRHDPSIIWEAQGQTLGVLQECFQRLLDWFGVTALRSRMDLFSYSTLAFNTLAFGLVAWGLGRALPAGWRLRLLLAAAALFGIYGSWWGLFSARLPDYYMFEVTLTFACLGLFILQLTAPRISPARAAALGALAGAMAGIKITLLPTALLPLLPGLMHAGDPPRATLRLAGSWTAGLAAMLVTVIAAYYQFDFGHLREAFQAWRSFVSAPGAEPGFVSSLLHPFAATNNPWADHRFFAVILALWLLALAALGHAFLTERTPRRSHAVLLAFVLACSALHVWAVCKRPAETTLFETALFLTAAGAMMLASLPTRPAYQKAISAWITLMFGWSLVSALELYPAPATIAALRNTSRNAWEIHDWLNETGRPVVVLLPDDRYVSGTVEETLLKGFSDVPTWNITSGYALLDIVAPRRLFVTKLSVLPAGSVLLWTDVPGTAPLAKVNRTGLTVLGQLPRQERSWPMQSNQYWSRTVHGAIFADPSDNPAALVLKCLVTSRDASPKDPLAGFSISPGGATPRIEQRFEAGRQVVRITATKATPYLALGGFIPFLPDNSAPLRVKSTLRVDTPRLVLWQIYHAIDAHGTMESRVEPISARSSTWTTWTMEKPATAYSSPTDNFSVGIVDPQPGDWFEVSELSLLLETTERAKMP